MYNEQEVTGRAISQVTVVEVKYMDEITTEGELTRTKQYNLEVPVTVRIKKSFGGTQTATI